MQKAKRLKMVINKKAICDKYGSLRVFCEEENISECTFYQLDKKKGIHFQKGSKSFKVYHRLKDLGFITDENNSKDRK